MSPPLLKFSAGFCLLVLLAGCQSAKPAEDPAPPAVVRLPITRVQRQDLSSITRLTGTVNALPDHSVKVSPAVAGKLTAVLVVPGQRITRGQLIARLDNRQSTGQLAQTNAALQSATIGVAQAQTNLQLARDTLDRVQMLYNEKIAPQKDLIAAQSQLATSKEQLQAAKSQVVQAQATRVQSVTQLGFAELRSPISGVVARRFLNVGDTTDPTTPIVHVVDLTTVIINASQPADSPVQIQTGQKGRIQSPAQGGQDLVGTVTAVSPIVDPQSNTLSIQLRCLNPKGQLKEGQSVAVQVTTSVHRAALSVPKTALVPDPDQPNARLVYKLQDGKITRVPVRTGIEERGKIEILSGLSAGEMIAASGAYGLPDGTAVEALP
jgi:RND family efflux transporter MFP subunit